MQLLLVRHAIAAERGRAWPDDGLRPLTPEGRDRMKDIAAGLAKLVEPGLILSSPLVRAMQTAQILADAWPRARLRDCEALAWGDTPALLGELASADMDVVAAVGHEPHCSRSLSYLLSGSHAAVRTTFKKGAAALVSFPGAARAGDGTLEWLLQPRTLRLLA